MIVTKTITLGCFAAAIGDQAGHIERRRADRGRMLIQLGQHRIALPGNLRQFSNTRLDRQLLLLKLRQPAADVCLQLAHLLVLMWIGIV